MPSADRAVSTCGWPLAIALIAVSLAPPLARAQNRTSGSAPGAPAAETSEDSAAGEDQAPSGSASESQSIGVPDRGRLRHGVALEENEHVFVRQSRRRATYGTAELVGMIQRAAATITAVHAGPKMVIGDLSRERGGRLHPHRSHRSGRDVDIGFYLRDPEGQPVQPPRFVQLRRNGCGRIGEDRYCFEPTRNWDLVVAMLTDPVARVQYILVAPDIRRRLLAEGERREASEALLERVRIATAPHSGSHSHRSHFHVRIYCPVDDRPRCNDEPPFHEWYLGEPAPPDTAVRRLRARQRRLARRRAALRARRRARARARQRARARRRAAVRRERAARRRRARQRRQAQ